jgi:hypothetical protein
MIDGIEPFYQQIADSIRESINASWETATIEVIFFPQSSEYVGEWFSSGTARPTGFGVDLKAMRAFRGLRELFRKSGNRLWCRAVFEMRSAGQFKMNWGYDDCDENGFARFDEQKQAERLRQIRMRQGQSS